MRKGEHRALLDHFDDAIALQFTGLRDGRVFEAAGVNRLAERTRASVGKIEHGSLTREHHVLSGIVAPGAPPRGDEFDFGLRRSLAVVTASELIGEHRCEERPACDFAHRLGAEQQAPQMRARLRRSSHSPSLSNPTATSPMPVAL